MTSFPGDMIIVDFRGQCHGLTADDAVVAIEGSSLNDGGAAKLPAMSLQVLVTWRSETAFLESGSIATSSPTGRATFATMGSGYDEPTDEDGRQYSVSLRRITSASGALAALHDVIMVSHRCVSDREMWERQMFLFSGS